MLYYKLRKNYNKAILPYLWVVRVQNYSIYIPLSKHCSKQVPNKKNKKWIWKTHTKCEKHTENFEKEKCKCYLKTCCESISFK